MKIVLNNFTGMIPKLGAERLPDNAAAYAVNCDFVSGELRGMRAPGVHTLGLTGTALAMKSMFVYEPYSREYGWTFDVNAVRSPVTSDQYNRFYWTNNDTYGMYVSQGDPGNGGGGWTPPSASNTLRVGVPRPKYRVGSSGSGDPDAMITFSALSSNDMKLAGVSFSSVQWTAVWEDGAGVVIGSQTVSASYNAPTYQATKATITSIPPRPDPVPTSTVVATSDTTVSDYLQSKIESGSYQLYYEGNVPFVLPVGIPNTATNIYARDYGTGVKGTTTTSNSTADNKKYELILEMKVLGASQTDFSVRLRHGVPQTLPGAASNYSATLTYTESTNSAIVSITASASSLETRAYTYTLVNRFEEESAPAPASDVITIVRGQPVAFTIPSVQIDSGYAAVTKVRIYRTATGSSNTSYLFLKSLPVTTTPSGQYAVVPSVSLTDDTSASGLAESLMTAGYEPPPVDLLGLVSMGNGMLAGFRSNEVHVSEPYLPYAFNPANVLTFPNKVVALCATESSLYVLTTSHPYLVSGVTPDSLTSQRLPALQAGTTLHCATQINNGIVYASYDGLVFCQGLNATLEPFTKYMSRDTWRDSVYPYRNSIRMTAHAGDLILSFDNGARQSMVFRLEEDGGSLTENNSKMETCFVSPVDDLLYFKSGTKVYVYRGGGEGDVTGTTGMAYRWTSKIFALPKPLNMGVLQVIGDGPATVTVTAYSSDMDDVHAPSSVSFDLTLRANDPSGTIVRLPGGFISRRWRVEVLGSAKTATTPNTVIRQIVLAQIPSELRDV